jgi:hypothetical protein
MYISCKERGLRGAERTIRKHASILGREMYLGFYVGGSAPCSKNIGVRPIKWLLLEET